MNASIPVSCGRCGVELPPGSGNCTTCGTPRTHAQPQAVQPAPAGGSFASSGQLRQNQTYVGQRLLFAKNGQVEDAFANLVTGSMILKHFLATQFAQALLWVLCFIVPGLLSLIMSGFKVKGAGVPLFFMLLYFPLMIGIYVFALMYFRYQPLSEWEILLDERSPNADTTFAAINQALQRRDLPAQVYPMRISTDPTTGVVGNYLVMSKQRFTVFITVRPYGNGLYVAWSMWHQSRYWRLYLDLLLLAFNTIIGKASLMHRLLRAEEARAMRETVHNAVRDGVESALAQERLDVVAAFNGVVPPVRPINGLPKSFDPRAAVPSAPLTATRAVMPGSAPGWGA